MISFRAYLESGGAFGQRDNWNFSQDQGRYGMFQQSPAGIENKYQVHRERVAFGKGKESVIMDAMRDVGWSVKPARDQEDYMQHIDAWVKKTPQSAAIPVQIKYRDAGDDILLEVIKYWSSEMFTRPLMDSDFNGRDMSGVAIQYVGLNLSRDVLRVRSIKEGREIAKDMTEILANDFKTMGRQIVKCKEGTIRITPDPANGREKVIAYINPEAFTDKQDIKLKNPLW